jgi:hypothetical protein
MVVTVTSRGDLATDDFALPLPRVRVVNCGEYNRRAGKCPSRKGVS